MMIYVHVPFCRSKCRYCAFFSEPLGGRDAAGRVALYLDGVRAELALRAREAEGDRRAESVFFGGGTPSLLPADALIALLEAIREEFAVADDAEISLEGNPESLTVPGRLKKLFAAGFNRLSMGAQSMDADDLRLLGRPYSPHEVAKAVKMAREAGFSNVGVDLMWGLPGQTVAGWLKQIEAVAVLHVEHVSTYSLTLEPGTPLAKDVGRGLLLPQDDVLAEMYLEGSACLEAHGFRQYEISNFARPGFACRHNLGYWSGKAYLGLGPSAVSTAGSVRRTNPADIPAWLAMTRGERCAEKEKPDATDLAEELLMLRLRTAHGLDLEEFVARTGIDFLRRTGAFTQELVRTGLAEPGPERLRLTRRGMLVSNEILARLFEIVSDAAK